MLVALVAAVVAAPVPQIDVYTACVFTPDSGGHCPVLVAGGGITPYCCAAHGAPVGGVTAVLGRNCVDLFEGADYCDVVVASRSAAWCCRPGQQLSTKSDPAPESDDDPYSWAMEDDGWIR